MNLNEQIVAVELDLTAEQIATMNKPVRGHGGFQNLMRKIQKQSTFKVVLKLDLGDVEKMKRYAKYGNGGFEGRLLKLLQKSSAVKTVKLESKS